MSARGYNLLLDVVVASHMKCRESDERKNMPAELLFTAFTAKHFTHPMLDLAAYEVKFIAACEICSAYLFAPLSYRDVVNRQSCAFLPRKL